MRYNHHFDMLKPWRPYTRTTHANLGSIPGDGVLRSESPTLPIKKGTWPCLSDRGDVVQVEDHRRRSVDLGFPLCAEQEATIFFLPGDTWESDPSTMDEVGPLPAGASLTRPEKTADDERQDQIRIIKHKLEIIDQESIRPIRASIGGTATDADVQRLKDLEEKARGLRKQLEGLLLPAI